MPRKISKLGQMCLAFVFAAKAAHAQSTAGAAQKASPLDGAAQNGAAPSMAMSNSEEPKSEASESDWRRASLFEQNSVSGSTGLLHLAAPGSEAAGTFRVSLLADWSSGHGFLCNTSTPCGSDTHDAASRFGSVLGLSVTPLSFLEAYASLHSSASSDDQHSPGLIDVLGNTTLGAKVFTPEPFGRIFSVGGAAELELLNGAGSLGVDGKGTSFRVSALGEADLQKAQGSQLPLRLITNFSYFFDNSGSLVDDTEASRGTRITRVERFGLGINRVDQFQAGLGVEAAFPIVHPFIEWNVGVPVNRQSYTCSSATRYSGDQCLSQDDSFSAFPSNLTLGARFFPFLKGLSATAAVDIATSGTSNFIDELAPTMPWDVWLGVGYAFDIREPEPRQVVVVEHVTEELPAKPELRARGFVRERGKEAGLANAVLRYQGRELTAMATGSDGHFVSEALLPGTYTFSIEADGFKPGECSVVIPTAAPASGTTAKAALQGSTAPAAPVTPVTPQPIYFDMDCELEALPRAGNIGGVVLDSDSASPIAGATVELSDSLGRSLQLVTDASGAFRFERVLPGAITLKAEAPGYLFRTQAVQLAQRQEAHAEVSLRKRPKLAHVSVGTNEIRINQQVHFEQDSAVILPDSQALLEEIADALASTPRITKVEIQGHTDNNGAPEHNKTLSEARANAVLDWLTSHGIDASRLVARGYGQERPMSPNVTPQARARNRRVQFMILDKAPAP